MARAQPRLVQVMPRAADAERLPLLRRRLRAARADAVGGPRGALLPEGGPGAALVRV